MIRQAEKHFAIDLPHSFVVGDKLADVGLATSVGARGILVRTGYGAAELVRHGGNIPGAAYVAEELMDATSWILTDSRPPAGGVMSPRISPARFRQILSRFRRVRLVVVGDLVADEFIYGRIDRVSREAPVLILKYDSTEIVPGGAGNAASNAAALGATVDVIGVVGADDAGTRLLPGDAEIARSSTRVARVSRYVTPVKTRILAGGVHSAKQQVVRIDRAGGASGSRGRSRTSKRALASARSGAPTR